MPAELRIRPSRAPLAEMGGAELSKFLRALRTDFFRGGQNNFDDGVGFFLGEVDGIFKFSIGDSAGNKVTWDGNELVIVGDLLIAPGNFFASGQTAYDTGVGWWFENIAGVPRFSFGDSAGARVTFNGTELEIFDIKGIERTIDNLFFKGDSDTHPAIGQLLGSTVTTVNPPAATDWQVLRTIQTDFSGSFRLRVEASRVDTIGAPPNPGSWRLKNGIGSVVHTETFSSTSFADAFSDEEAVTEAGEIWTLEGLSESDLTTWTLDTRIRDVEVRARMNHATIT